MIVSSFSGSTVLSSGTRFVLHPEAELSIGKSDIFAKTDKEAMSKIKTRILFSSLFTSKKDVVHH